jgi:hypothetical protein
VGGVRFLGVNSSWIDHNAANNDTRISYSLFQSSNNRVTGNTADYPFTANLLIADGSTLITIDGNDFGTADFIGILVANPLAGPYTTGETPSLGIQCTRVARRGLKARRGSHLPSVGASCCLTVS